jgi:uncharacterized membrane protein YedE/YeeE
MTLVPLPLADLLGDWGAYSIYLLIGVAFGATLETAGFGNSMKLAAQFYFRDMTVFKVMFTAIIVAMTLIFLSSAIGLLDYNLVWVPPTYLWPGIVGGLIMGVGFIVGGFCPGTSLVAMATGKIDGIFFVLGVLFGIFVFGETVSAFAVFFESSYLGRFTLPELFGASYGSVVLGIVVAALLMFLLAEKVEAIVNKESQRRLPAWSLTGAAGLVGLAVAAMLIGQPDNRDRWEAIAAGQQARLDAREVRCPDAGHVAALRVDRLEAVEHHEVPFDRRTGASGIEVDSGGGRLVDAVHVDPGRQGFVLACLEFDRERIALTRLQAGKTQYLPLGCNNILSLADVDGHVAGRLAGRAVAEVEAIRRRDSVPHRVQKSDPQHVIAAMVKGKQSQGQG